WLLKGKVCDISDYGAIGDGITDNTKAIQLAINDCITNNSLIQNEVLLSQSKINNNNNTIYLSGALFLGSNINFHFEDNVTLLASPIKNSTAYPFIYTRYTGTMTMTLSSLLN